VAGTAGAADDPPVDGAVAGRRDLDGAGLVGVEGDDLEGLGRGGAGQADHERGEAEHAGGREAEGAT
jgi:hypothetical protein